MTSYILQTAIAMNNEGAHLLQSGQTLDALRVLRQAVRVVKQVSEQAPPTPHETCSSSPDSCKLVSSAPSSSSSPAAPSSSAPASTPAAAAAVTPATSCCSSENRPATSGLVYMHRRPLFLPSHFQEILAACCSNTASTFFLTRQEWDSIVHTAIVYTLFNMALACHSLSMESGLTAPLRHAKELYQNVARIRNSSRNGSTASASGVANIGLVQGLALNNLSHLHYEQCDYEGSQYYMGCLRDLIIHTPYCLDEAAAKSGSHGGSTTGATDAAHVSEYEVEEIKLNVLYWRPPSAAQAA